MKDNREARFRRGPPSFLFVFVLLPVLLWVCVSISLGQDSQQEAQREARAWLVFNHHVGGVIVLVLAGLTWLELLDNSSVKAFRPLKITL